MNDVRYFDFSSLDRYLDLPGLYGFRLSYIPHSFAYPSNRCLDKSERGSFIPSSQSIDFVYRPSALALRPSLTVHY
jgi:hypothetical protein